MTQLDRKWGLAAVESDKPAIPSKAYQASKLYRKRKLQRSVKVRLRNVAVSPCISPRCSNNTKLSPLIVERVQTRCLIADVSLKHPSLRSLLHFGYWTFPQSAKLHQAALRLQVNFAICMTSSIMIFLRETRTLGLVKSIQSLSEVSVVVNSKCIFILLGIRTKTSVNCYVCQLSCQRVLIWFRPLS